MGDCMHLFCLDCLHARCRFRAADPQSCKDDDVHRLQEE